MLFRFFSNENQDVIHVSCGQRYVFTHPEWNHCCGKSLYLALTTLLGARTLGEEYVDLMYVNRSGKRLPHMLPKSGLLSRMPFAVCSEPVSQKVESWQRGRRTLHVTNVFVVLHKMSMPINFILLCFLHFLGWILFAYVYLECGTFSVIIKTLRSSNKLQAVTVYCAVILLPVCGKGTSQSQDSPHQEKLEKVDQSGSDTLISNIGQLEKSGEKVNNDENLTNLWTLTFLTWLCHIPETTPPAVCRQWRIQPRPIAAIFLLDLHRGLYSRPPGIPVVSAAPDEQNLLPLR